MAKHKRFPSRGNATVPPPDDTLVVEDPDAGPLPWDESLIQSEFRPFPEAADEVPMPARNAEAIEDLHSAGFPDEELTPPVANLPTTGEAVEDLLTQVALAKQRIDDLIVEGDRLRDEHVKVISAQGEAEADLAMIRARVADLEQALAETESSRAVAFVDTQLAAEKVVDLENRLLASELRGNDLQWELTKHKETLDSLSQKKLWIIVPAVPPNQKQGQRPVRLHVLASDVIEAIERAIRAGALSSKEDAANTSVMIDRVIF